MTERKSWEEWGTKAQTRFWNSERSSRRRYNWKQLWNQEPSSPDNSRSKNKPWESNSATWKKSSMTTNTTCLRRCSNQPTNRCKISTNNSTNTKPNSHSTTTTLTSKLKIKIPIRSSKGQLSINSKNRMIFSGGNLKAGVPTYQLISWRSTRCSRKPSWRARNLIELISILASRKSTSTNRKINNSRKELIAILLSTEIWRKELNNLFSPAPELIKPIR